MKGVALAVAGLVFAGASGCGRSQRTPEQGSDGGDTGSSGTTGVERGGTGATGGEGGGGAAGKGNPTTSGSAGSTSNGGRAGAGGGSVGGAGVFGSGGLAGAVMPLTDAEVCADACAQTEHSLPSALCEDWRFPDYEHVPEYCRTVEALDCAGRCEEQLGAVSSACNAALHRAIPCVARTDLYQHAAIPSGCIFGECTGMLLGVSAECHGLRQEVARAREVWASAGSNSYSYTFSSGSSVADIVVRDGMASVVAGEPSNPHTIPELFDWIEGSLEYAPAIVTYDAMLGYPSEAVFRSPDCYGQSGYSFAVTDLVLE